MTYPQWDFKRLLGLQFDLNMYKKSEEHFGKNRKAFLPL
jgi:hypothetical protein